MYDYSTTFKAIYKIHKADNQIRTEYLKSTDGIVCSPLKQKDYNNRFIFYFSRSSNRYDGTLQQEHTASCITGAFL